ncbi:MAG: ATP-binding cassette domain-containing protein [Thermoplasmatota archaeon]
MEARGLTIRRNGSTILTDINFRIARGSATLFTGPNGAGKSTLLAACAGLLPWSEGEVRVEGIHVAKEGARARRVLSYVPDGRSLYGELTVRENLSFIGSFHMGTRTLVNRIASVANDMGLSSILDENVMNLSHGYHRRAALAAAFLTEPRALLLDEPFAGLDGGGSAALRAAIERARNRGAAILIAAPSEAHVGEALGWLDRELVLSEGRIVEDRDLAPRRSPPAPIASGAAA